MHTRQEQRVIEEYQVSVDNDLVDFYLRAQTGDATRPYRLKRVSEKAAEDIRRLKGQSVDGFETTLEPRIAQHINIDHGENGRADHTMADSNDVGRIQYVLDNYDTVEPGGTTDAYWEPRGNGRNRQAQTVVFSKKVNGTYYAVEAVPETKARRVYIVSAYMSADGKTPPGRRRNKTAEAQSRLPDAKAPWFTAKTDAAITTPADALKVSQFEGNVNYTPEDNPAGVKEENIETDTPAGTSNTDLSSKNPIEKSREQVIIIVPEDAAVSLSM